MDCRIALCAALLTLVATPGNADTSPPRDLDEFTVDVLVDGRPLRKLSAEGRVYVEAVKGGEYAIRLRNPWPVRVAVALSVDGLNTIDARHTSADVARKWVIGPRETITISGWQASRTHARRFYFTSEERSYAEALGRPDNLGIISAVFFRERVPRPMRHVKPPAAAPEADAAGGGPRRDASRPNAPAAAEASEARHADRQPAPAEREELAATGFGRQTDHVVREVYLDLEADPAASIDVRYEYRAQLVRLGILPAATALSDALARREGAQGFASRFCPDPRIR